MAVKETGEIFKGLIFDGESSKTYGVYITGEAVFNAPEREVEMVAIPGRNGAYALDKGRFENIEVTYTAGLFADNEIDFAAAVSDFRNFLCSRVGYCRLTDDYNKDEYRLAVYKSGLEVTPALLKAGEFEITFECQPQRFLISGDSPITVADGDTLYNPTLFKSNPLLMIYGYGAVAFNGSEIMINNIEVGKIPLFEMGAIKTSAIPNNQYSYTYTFDENLLSAGDAITLSRLDVFMEYVETSTWDLQTSSIYSQSGTSFDFTTYCGLRYTYTGYGNLGYTFRNMTFNKGESKVYERQTTFRIQYYEQSPDEYLTLSVALNYDGDGTFTLTVTTPPAVAHSAPRAVNVNEYNTDRTAYATSTKSALGSPLYVDCEIGEAYKYEGDTVVSINEVASLPAELPTFAAGANEISFDNTITRLDVVPRWWKV